MPWPVDDLSTAGVDSGADRPPRAEFFKLFQRVKTVIGARGTTDGIASLDGRRRVPDTELGRAIAGGVAALDGTGRVPAAQLPPPPTIPDAVPPGTICMWAGSDPPPTGWFNCYGGAISRTAYAALFAVIGTTYGTGNGSTTFTLPNMSSRMPLGRGGGRNRGDTGGAETHRLTVGEMPAHAHDLGGTRTDAAGTDRNKHTGASGAVTTVAANNAYGVKNTGGGAAHNNMPPYFVINFIIKW